VPINVLIQTAFVSLDVIEVKRSRAIQAATFDDEATVVRKMMPDSFIFTIAGNRWLRYMHHNILTTA
jgi:hypothetical protein